MLKQKKLKKTEPTKKDFIKFAKEWFETPRPNGGTILTEYMEKHTTKTEK